MQQRKLGQDGPIISAVGYGAMSFTDFYGPAIDSESLKVLDACAEMGITHLDTSNVYGMGRSEDIIGKWLRSRRGQNPFTIATKAGITRDPDYRFNNTKEHLAQSLDASLTRLGVDVIDLFYVHRRDPNLEIEEVTQTLADFVKAGKIKAIGFSEIAPSSLLRAHAVHPIAAVQSEYSLSTRSPEMGLTQACADIGATLMAFSPVGRGLLTDRPHKAEQIEEMSFLKENPRFIEPNLTANLAYNLNFKLLAAEMGLPAASLAIAWVLHQGDQIMAIPGTRQLHHLEELVRGGEVKLSDQDVKQLETVLPIGWAHGERYSAAQWVGPERYC
jgi:aryl-alcohol dehydrogenase-like predicted oxidoreductase